MPPLSAQCPNCNAELQLDVPPDPSLPPVVAKRENDTPADIGFAKLVIVFLGVCSFLHVFVLMRVADMDRKPEPHLAPSMFAALSCMAVWFLLPSWYRCSACGNRISPNSKLCPTCRATIAK